MSKNQLPKTIFVRLEQDGDENYLIAGKTPEDTSSGVPGKEKCGYYRLEEEGILNTKTVFEK
jgi:hypothetical protein